MIQWFLDLANKTLESEAATGMTAGAIVLGAITFIGYQLRSIPQRLMAILDQQFTVSLTVYGDDPVFHPLSLWLGQQPSTKKSRRVNVVTNWDNHDGTQTHKLTPGPGLHILRFQSRWFLVNKQVSQPGASDGRGQVAPSGNLARKSETLTITTYGRNSEILQSLIVEVADAQKSRDTMPIHFWAGNGFSLCAVRTKRPLPTVYLDDALKHRITTDLNSFLARRQWYAERGIPWRRGYLLEGPPGTGKSTLIFALASLLDKPVYIINPSTIIDDSSLMQAMNMAGAGIVVIEDADTFKVTKERARKRPQQMYGGPQLDASSISPVVAAPRRDDDSEGYGITLSGLLNAIDGIASAEGRILFITSNHPDVLDAALLRPGRIDVRERLGLAHASVARQMFAAYFPEGDAEAFIREIAPRLPMAPAAIQNLLLERTEQTNSTIGRAA